MNMVSLIMQMRMQVIKGMFENVAGERKVVVEFK